MGQYYKDHKIGTCEDMYYMRLDEARKLAARGERDNDGISFIDYLKDNQTRWRFPWPDEDNTNFFTTGGKRHYERSFMVACPESLKVDHDGITVSNSHEGGGYNVNIFLPCPHDPAFAELHLETSFGGAGQQFLEVRMQAIREDKEKTIFACARCGKLQRFSDEDVQKIKEASREHYAVYKRESEELYKTGGNKGLYEFAEKVIDRLQ